MTAKTEVLKPEKFSLGDTVMLAVEATREALRRVFTKDVSWEQTDITAGPIKHPIGEAEGIDRHESSRTVRIVANVRGPLTETTPLHRMFEAVCELGVSAGEPWSPRRVSITISRQTYTFGFDGEYSSWRSEEMGDPAFHIYEFPDNPEQIYL